MLKSKTRWIVRQSDQDQINDFSKELQVSPLVASLLINRGLHTVDSARTFLFEENQHFHDPYLLEDMTKAVERIKKAIETQEPILVFGDYDADGVSSTTVMMTALKDAGAIVDFYIPNRFTEGYGPNEAAFRHAAEQGFSLIITVDTGISALHEADVAIELGIDLIITDHHEPGPTLPNAFAIIHPKLPNSQYPFKELAGVGVAFKVAHALYGEVPEHLLDVASIGTIADLVSLHGENRLIARKGIKKLRATKRAGLKALYKLASVELGTINEETIGFVIAPRINAVGRLESADPAVHLLLTEDPYEAEMLAEEIDGLNKERQAIVNEITEEAIREVEENFPPEENKVLVIGKEGWNAGVIGIVASRLVDKFYRPTIVLSYDSEKGQAKGSARSIVGFDLFKNLSESRDILPHFGGHPMAAGMTLKLDDVGELRKRLNHQASEVLTDEDFIPVTQLDCEALLENIDLKAIEQLQLLSPFGMDNPKPKVIIKGSKLTSMRKIGADQTHLKVTLENEGHNLDGIGFGFGEVYEHIAPVSTVDVIGELSINEWNNIRKPQIFLQDIAVNHWQLFDYRGLNRMDKLLDVLPPSHQQWIVFNEETIHELSLQDKIDEQFTLIRSEKEASDLIVDGKNIILVDLPSSKEMLSLLLKEKTPERVYVYFYQRQQHYFSTLPTREHFKWFYAFLSKKGSFDLNRFGDDLAKHRGWTKETIDFMSQVFFELDFVKINNGFISLSSDVKKRDLSDSPLYEKKQAQFALENDLLYSSYQQLKDWFDKATQGSQKYEEEVEQWI